MPVRLVTIGAALVVAVAVPLAAMGFWIERDVRDRERWVAATAPLIEEPAVVDALAADLTATLTPAIATTVAGQVPLLPGSVRRDLEEWIGVRVPGLIEPAIRRTLETEVVEDLWVRGTTLAHGQVDALLDGRDTALVVGGRIAVDLTPLLRAVAGSAADVLDGVPLGPLGIEIDPDDDLFGLADRELRFVVVDLRDVTGPTRAAGVVAGLRVLWVLLAVVASGIAIGTSRSRAGDAAVVLGAGTAGLVVLLLGLGVAAPEGGSAVLVVDALQRNLRSALRVAVAVGAVGTVALVAGSLRNSAADTDDAADVRERPSP